MASRQFLVDINLSRNQLLNAKLQNLATHPSVSAGTDDGFVYWNTTDDTVYAYTGNGSSWLDLGSSGVTNLGYTSSASNGIVTSDTGTNATIPLATPTGGSNIAGLLSPTDKDKLDNLSGTNTGDQTITLTGDVTGSGTGSFAATIAADAVTYSKIQNVVSNDVILGNIGGAGAVVAELTAGQVRTLLNVADGANNYVHPDHTGDVSSTGDGATVIANDAVTYAKMQNVSSDDVLLGNVAGIGQPVAELSPATVRTLLNVADGANNYSHPNHTGDVTSTGDGATTIANDAVTYGKIQNVVGNNVLLGNNSGAGGIVDELSASEVRTILNVEDGADVTDATNVNAAGAVMESDISGTPSGRIIDDDTMATASNTTLATSESIKAYVDGVVAGGMVYKGGYDANTNTPDLDSTPIATAIGDTYTVTAAGTFFSTAVQVGDVIICEAINATTEGEWTIVNKNIPDIVSATETEEGLVELATQAEVDAGTDTSRAVTPATLANTLGTDDSNLNAAVRYTAQIGDTASTSITVTHNIGRQFLTAQVFETASTYDLVDCVVRMDSTTQTTFIFNSAPGTNEYTVVITG